ncbi:DMT family transporter [Vibrio sp. SCSIO 43137]|uniref:DMT family transporter n=1 Tax=Vibrio sp. SCSIO 43137 TaxID=3021011 RepID=UPI002307873C|nr:DMT family transporter [Vibrio sp. SCSIO 43137]WCE32279.1 DMT family transporter [Vibrio sp. SCSIO 43137]
MIFYIFLALINGICIALSRILNGQLSQYRGAFHASYINHLIGFAFLTLLVLSWFGLPEQLPTDFTLYTGGVIGALYVAVNSLVMTKLGSTNAIILVISGQMLLSLLIDMLIGLPQNMLLSLTGVVLIVAGIATKEFIRLSSRTSP